MLRLKGWASVKARTFGDGRAAREVTPMVLEILKDESGGRAPSGLLASPDVFPLLEEDWRVAGRRRLAQEVDTLGPEVVAAPRVQRLVLCLPDDLFGAMRCPGTTSLIAAIAIINVTTLNF
jgi:hypothetical protein